MAIGLHGRSERGRGARFAREVNADVLDADLAEILAGYEYEAIAPVPARAMRLPSARQPGRLGGCALSLLVFGAAMAGIGYFCEQGLAIAGSLDLLRAQGPFIVLHLPWEDILAYIGLALGCGVVACLAFLAGSARTGLVAERRHPLIPAPPKRRR
ncbi:MAG TPA: hypothetical protein VFY89_08685 [Ktedonobacterales bacterium]